MFYGETVQETRQLFFLSWEKYQKNQPLSALEQSIVKVIADHPEYHSAVKQLDTYQQHSYYPELGETNPFLHMGLHLAVREQVATDRPLGIKQCYDNLLKKYKKNLEVEHLMMDRLAECLWQSQKNNLPPDETLYLESLNKL